MTQRFLVPAADAAGEVVFDAAQVHQLRHVLRLRPGATVQVFDGRTPIDLVVELSPALTGRVVGQLAQAPEPRTRICAWPALLTRDKFEGVLQKLTEIGVAEITPVLTERTLVRRGLDPGRLGRWGAILREAAEQCGRGQVPTLRDALPLPAALEAAAGRVLVATQTDTPEALATVLADRPSVVSLFVGPEGGFAPTEVAIARAAGGRLVALGPRTLRTETASPILAALVLYVSGDLSSADDDGRA